MNASRARFLHLLVPPVALLLLWHLADGRAVLDRLAGADPRWLLAALAATSLQTILSALRWRLTARRLGLSLTTTQAISEYYLCTLVNQTLPGGVLGDAARAVRSSGQGLRTAALAVVIERLAGQVALLAVALAGLALAPWQSYGLTLPSEARLVPPALAAAAVLVVIGVRHARRARPRIATHPGPGFGDALRVSLLARGVWPRQVTLGLAIVTCNLLTFAFCARATGSSLPALAVLILVPLILTSMLVPLSVAGWGLREGAAAGLLPLAGLTPEAAVAASLAFGGVIIAGSLPGAVMALRAPP